ncbi:MAG TPA: poly-beta-1,6 N-acetyl-D-glucosamine export porin PgaA [Pseudomonadales bacterium]|jgi:biofilm PGA synthesis protein PgaA|nr:poly-beta-1,6 N-acetyl-D-glucosamine export porin PgaA [Pseudomonadales bacterium]
MRWLAVTLIGCLLAGVASADSLRDQGGKARRAGDFVHAEALFRQALQAEPNHAALSLDVATVLVDQQQYPQAQQWLRRYVKHFGESEAYWLTMGYFYDRQARFFDSLDCYDRALRINPNSEIAMRNRIQTVDTLGMPDKALSLARVNAHVVTKEEWMRLYADSAAYAVRIAGMDEPDRQRRYQKIKTAIHRCDDALTYVRENFPDRIAAQQQLRMDRILVLGLDSQHQAVLDEYILLLKENAILRDDVRVAIAQSALHVEKPELAEIILQPLIDKKTQDGNARTLMFYAQLESEKFDEAKKTIDALIADEKTFRFGQASNIVGKNWSRVNADTNRVMWEAWGNTLDLAQEEMVAYQAKAPFNPHLRSALGGVYQLRGWPRRSENIQRDVLQQSPDLYSAWSGVVGSRMALHDFYEAGKITKKLVRSYPELKSSESLQEDWRVHNMQELSMTFSLGHSKSSGDSSGNAGAYGSEDFDAEVWWYSNPIDQQYRAFFHTSSHTGTFEEGKGQIDRYGVGVEQRDHINNVAFRNTVEINSSYSSDTDLGLALTTEWQLDDRWSVEGAAETFSSQLPVRAYNAGITAHSLESGVKYRVDEGEYYRTGLTYVDFSDGNQRWMFGAQGYQVVWSNPHHQWALLETVYASSNSKNNTIYFNPSNDLDVGLAAEYQGIIRRRYDFEFRHTLLVGLGAYSQNGFGTDPTAQVTYRHNWKRDKELEWFYGVGMNYHSYDGERELRSTAFGGFTWRFD